MRERPRTLQATAWGPVAVTDVMCQERGLQCDVAQQCWLHKDCARYSTCSDCSTAALVHVCRPACRCTNWLRPSRLPHLTSCSSGCAGFVAGCGCSCLQSPAIPPPPPAWLPSCRQLVPLLPPLLWPPLPSHGQQSVAAAACASACMAAAHQPLMLPQLLLRGCWLLSAG